MVTAAVDEFAETFVGLDELFAALFGEEVELGSEGIGGGGGFVDEALAAFECEFRTARSDGDEEDAGFLRGEKVVGGWIAAIAPDEHFLGNEFVIALFLLDDVADAEEKKGGRGLDGRAAKGGSAAGCEFVPVDGTGEDELAELLDEGVIAAEVGDFFGSGRMEADDEGFNVGKKRAKGGFEVFRVELPCPMIADGILCDLSAEQRGEGLGDE